MSTANKSTRRSLAILGLAKSVSALITQATNIVTRVTGNPYFPAPVPNLALITTAIDALPRRDQDGRGRLEPARIARDSVSERASSEWAPRDACRAGPTHLLRTLEVLE